MLESDSLVWGAVSVRLTTLTDEIWPGEAISLLFGTDARQGLALYPHITLHSFWLTVILCTPPAVQFNTYFTVVL